VELLHASERIARIAENPLLKREEGQRPALSIGSVVRRDCAAAWSIACRPVARPPLTAEPVLILPRRFATELAREEARMLCDELMAEEAIALTRHDLIDA
jgi:hypothetical protein